eukprot:1768539-Rhodomonas_salina.1
MPGRGKSGMASKVCVLKRPESGTRSWSTVFGETVGGTERGRSAGAAGGRGMRGKGKRNCLRGRKLTRTGCRDDASSGKAGG